MTKHKQRVCVLGAGIVGLASAWALQEQGHEVVVIDQQAPGLGTSHANGAQLSYAYVQPLADPSIWGQIPKLLLQPESPLRWQPQADPQQWRWLMGFLAACRRGVSEDTTRWLLQLGQESQTAFEAFRQREQPDIDYNDHGKLVIYPTEASFAAARRQLALQQRLGSAPQQALNRAETLAVEPALANSREPWAGAIHTPSECAVDGYRLCTTLAQRLQARGAVLACQHRVLGLDVAPGRAGGTSSVRAVETDLGRFEADTFVVALGLGSRTLLLPLGLNLPLYPLKGYSLTGIPTDPTQAPRVSVTDAGRKVVFARLGERIRVAGMVELVGEDLRVDARRIAQLEAASQAWWPEADGWIMEHPWAGLRPATPTGQPLIGRHLQGPRNLLLNTGHGALGLTLAFGSAQRVAQALAA